MLRRSTKEEMNGQILTANCGSLLYPLGTIDSIHLAGERRTPTVKE